MSPYTIDTVYNYFTKHNIYHDIEERYIAGIPTTKEEDLLQDAMESFSYTLLKECISSKSYILDTDDFFETYLIFAHLYEHKLKISISYGQGSYFCIEKVKENFPSHLAIKLK